MTTLPWKPWHEVVPLREDLKSGDLPMHMFAADLYDVVMQKGKRPVYEKPEEFFALTFPTVSLRHLASDVALRLAGKNDKAVRQLELTYGGGKTHTLITLRHLVHDPDHLPDLPSVEEFIQEIGQAPPRSRIAALCFDKLDVEKGMEVLSPDGEKRTLLQPWSVLAYQLAGEEGLQLIQPEGQTAERETAPAENLLIELLTLPTDEDLGTLILIDEVLMYVREKVGQRPDWRGRMTNFFQYLTQAATKVDRCCVVASLLASDTKKSDLLGRELQAELYDIFGRQREEAVEPVGKEDVAEVLRRRFFKPEALKDRDIFRSHVVAALKGLSDLDPVLAKRAIETEERFLRSYPFHPDLTEVFYTKWTQLERFQKARGVLRTFALALREAVQWDRSPLIGPAVFLTAPGSDGLSEATRELVTVADTEEWEGKKPAWTGILDGELRRASVIQNESVGINHREVEQAVIATFLHSQPIGQRANTQDLLNLVAPTRPDRILLEKGLMRWARESYWLDDLYVALSEDKMPTQWRLGNRPNLNQMHADAMRNVSPEDAKARLIEEIGRVKKLTANASAAGVRAHTLPQRPRDIDDDGDFHYAILGPGAASESGKPSSEAVRYLDEMTGPDKPRVYRNALILLVPSREGLDVAIHRVQESIAWDLVREQVTKQQRPGSVDATKYATLQTNSDRSRALIPDAIRQAYCIVVTVSEKNEPQAFKLTITDEAHFTLVKNDSRSRMQDTAIQADALLPDGPYNLWRDGETFRRVKDLTGAFAQYPHLPKMLKADAIMDTLLDGCEKGIFVLRLPRPDKTFRTWWMSRPDDAAVKDPALELVLAEAAELSDIAPSLLAPETLPELYTGEEVKVKEVVTYFDGTRAVQVDRGGYKEPLRIPKATRDVVLKSVEAAVEDGHCWLLAPPASLWKESVPPGIINDNATLKAPPDPPAPAELLEENLPDAWTEGAVTALAIATALSVKRGVTLPWNTVRSVIDGAVRAHFLEVHEDAKDAWPCDLSTAQRAKFRIPKSLGMKSKPPEDFPSKVLRASSKLEPSQIQDLSDQIPSLLKIKAKSNIPIKFEISIECGDGDMVPSDDIRKEINDLLKKIKNDFQLS